MTFLGGLACLASVQATEPVNQPTGFTSSAITSYGFSISYTGAGADGYLVLRSGAPITDVPVDGVTYTPGQAIGASKVFSATATSYVPIKEVNAGATYYFAIFAYNGSGASIDYKQTAPLTGSVTTPDNMIGSYYAGLDQNSATFVTDLRNKIRAGKVYVPYSSYATTIVPAVMERDTTNQQKAVFCAYSHEVKIYSGSFSFTGIGYSREHSLPRSWFPTGGSTSSEEGSDYHNLYLTNLNDVNSPRSNYPYGEVTNASQTYIDFRLGTNNQGDVVAEPCEDVKGDVARSQLYMLICYNGMSGNWGYNNLASNGPLQDVDLLLTWHYQDLPDGREKAKHEYIASIQKNRNPFIDYPEWVDCINFRNLTRYAGCNYTVGLEEGYDQLMVKTWPNPATTEVHILMQQVKPGTVVRLVDMNGAVQRELYLDTEAEDYTFTLPADGLASGLYLLDIRSSVYYYQQKLFIQKQ